LFLNRFIVATPKRMVYTYLATNQITELTPWNDVSLQKFTAPASQDILPVLWNLRFIIVFTTPRY